MGENRTFLHKIAGRDEKGHTAHPWLTQGLFHSLASSLLLLSRFHRRSAFSPTTIPAVFERPGLAPTEAGRGGGPAATAHKAAACRHRPAASDAPVPASTCSL